MKESAAKRVPSICVSVIKPPDHMIVANVGGLLPCKNRAITSEVLGEELVLELGVVHGGAGEAVRWVIRGPALGPWGGIRPRFDSRG
jgi:hypothetical protein